MVDQLGNPPVAPEASPAPGAEGEEDRPLEPEKLLRLAGLVRAVLDEVREMSPDQATADELARLYERVTAQVETAVPNELRDELVAINLALPNHDGEEPEHRASGQEVRVAYAGLIGWLSGLFQGLQAAMQVQQLQGLAALQQGSQQGPQQGPQQGQGRPPGRESPSIEPGTGHYL